MGYADTLEELLAAATPGPWTAHDETAWEHAGISSTHDRDDDVAVVIGGKRGELGEHRGTRNAALIAALRNAAPELIALIRAAEYAASALTEHADDGDCAGPDGTPRRYSCMKCSTARDLTRALDALAAKGGT